MRVMLTIERERVRYFASQLSKHVYEWFPVLKTCVVRQMNNIGPDEQY